jgi:hypothetical protein
VSFYSFFSSQSIIYQNTYFCRCVCKKVDLLALRKVGLCVGLRAGLCAGWEIVFRLPVTEVDSCDIVDVLFICQIEFRQAGAEAKY